MAESEIVERVALAILAAQRKETFPNNLDLARAAIEAMREPTDAMIEAGAERHDHYAGRDTIGAANARRNVRQILAAVFDAALSPPNHNKEAGG